MVDGNTLMKQAKMTVHDYMLDGAISVSEVFNLEFGSAAHIEVCKAILPQYIRACAVDYDTSIKIAHERDELSH